VTEVDQNLRALRVVVGHRAGESTFWLPRGDPPPSTNLTTELGAAIFRTGSEIRGDEGNSD